MSAEQLLAELLQRGLHLWAEGEEICFRGPKGALTPVLRESIAQDKKPLLELLGTGGKKYVLASFAQQRLWFLDQLEPGNATYNIPLAIHLQGSLDVAALERSIQEIIRRHAALRTTFIAANGLPVQGIAPSASFHLPVTDLSALPPSEREDEAQRLTLSEARLPFDLGRGPLFRATLLRLGEAGHTLLLTLHHIVSDGWSLGVFNRELAVLYPAFCAGQPSPLPELPIQYADFASKQRGWLQGDVLQAQLDYWKDQLAGSPPVLELPTDRARPAVQTFRGTNVSRLVPRPLADALMALGRREGVTLFMTLLAAFDVLLHRYTGQGDIVVGTPIANRNRAEIEGLIGFFANTLVLRADLSGDPTFHALLGQVRDRTLGAYAHQDLPIEKLVEELQPQRDLGHTPLFQVMFILENTPAPLFALPGLTAYSVFTSSDTARVDLSLFATETEQGLELVAEYNVDLFDAATIERLLEHFHILLENAVAAPECRISLLPLMSAAEKHQVLVEWNDTARVYPPGECIHGLFEAQAERTPEAVALSFGDQRLTYGELNRRANRLAHTLQNMGVGPESVVGICIDRSPEMVVGLLGILKSGGAFLPLDPAYPPQRLAFMLEDAHPQALLTQAHLLEVLPADMLEKAEGREQFAVDEGRLTIISRPSSVIDRDRAAHTSDANPVSGALPDHPAYVIYTSGSTGRPKGVRGLHRGAVNRFRWMWETVPFEAGEVCCQKTALSFVDSIWEVFGPLLAGVRSVILPDETVRDPARLVQTLAAENVTRIVLVPSLLRAILETGDDLQERLSALKIWVTSGEALPVDLFQRFRQLLPEAVLLNLYGSSEVAADATWYDTRLGLPGASVPIGRPIANLQVYVLDQYRQPLPIGVPGEVYIGGAGLARDYLDRPDLTAERFIPAPFHGPSPAVHRLYRTGDRARWLPDGNLEFLGRLDHQVKVRGVRIELGEVEAALRQHPAVQQAVVVAGSDPAGGTRLEAYVVFHAGTGTSVSELRQSLREKLPEVMLPSVFIPLEVLPLTPSGKIDRLSLPRPDGVRPEAEESYVPPRTPYEVILAEVWQEVLGLAQVGAHDNFFDIGGHSLLATQVMARVRARFDIDLPVRHLFEAPTLAGLSQRLEQALIAEIQALDESEVEQKLVDG